MAQTAAPTPAAPTPAAPTATASGDFATSDALRDTILAHQTPRLALKLSDRKDGDLFVMDVRVSVS